LADFNGIWSGGLESARLGNFGLWVVDMRAISPSQTSCKNELGAQNDIFMGFFVGIRGNDSLLIFRNGGYFQGMQRISYLRCDSVRSNSSERYYRFVDLNAGASRLWSSFTFRRDSVIMETYSNGAFHMRWRARRTDTTQAKLASAVHNFPRRVVARNLTGAYAGRPDAVAFSFAEDVYPESAMPYLGRLTVNITRSATVPVSSTDKILVVLTPEDVFNGGLFPDFNVLNKRMRYVILSGWNGTGTTSFTFNYAHPGTYYLNVVLDKDNNGAPTSGDYIAFFDRDKSTSLPANGIQTLTANLDQPVP
jgi:hypothetical protein